MNVNTKGRVIHKGPKGGFYVLQDGKKVYKFVRQTVVPRTVVQVPVQNRQPVQNRLIVLKKFLEKVRKRQQKTGLVVTKFKNKNLSHAVFKHSGVHTTHKRTSTIKIPILPPNVNANTVMAIQEDYLPTQKWIDAQVKYLESLNEYDLETAMAFTVRSHEWIGPWLRGNMNSVTFSLPYPKIFIVPLFPQVKKLITTKNYDSHTWVKKIKKYDSHTWLKKFKSTYSYYRDHIKSMPKIILEDAMKLYVSDLRRIVANAPPLPRHMYVFRGLSKDIFKGTLGAVHTLEQFSSSAYVPQSVYSDGHYMRIKLLKGTRVLLLQALNHWENNGEFEILLNKGMHYIIRKRSLERPVINRHNGYITRQKVTDVTVYT